MREIFDSAHRGFVHNIKDGQTITYSLQDGMSLRKSVDGLIWIVETRPSPFVHYGVDTTYRIDCDVYEGTHKISELSPSGP